jgi:hypothetical protein
MPSPRRTPRDPFPAGTVLLVLLTIGMVGVGLWLWMRPGAPLEETDWAPSLSDSQMALEGEDWLPGLDSIPPLEGLPPLGESDALVRRLVSGLSAHPALVRWLVSDALMDRFVLAVVDVAGGFHPGASLPFLRPEAPFATRFRDGGLVVDEESYRRYDLLVTVFTSLDVAGTVRLYRQLSPLVDEAWASLGLGGAFDPVLAGAIEVLLEVRPLPEPIPVIPDEGMFLFADPQAEELRGAAKGLLRMGSANLLRVQDKLRSFQRALGFAPSVQAPR